MLWLQRKASASPVLFRASSIYSSLIEGSGIDVSDYERMKEENMQTKEFVQIEDLQNAYRFAKHHALNEKNLLHAHALLSSNLNITDSQKGQWRTKQVQVIKYGVSGSEVLYTAAKPEQVQSEMESLMNEVTAVLRGNSLTYDKAFYYASLLHYSFVKIHPFADGNGRAARLLEKWFLARIYGNVVWAIPSEANYWQHRSEYYLNLQNGKTFEELNLSKSVQFLLMLPQSFSIIKKFYL